MHTALEPHLRPTELAKKTRFPRTYWVRLAREGKIRHLRLGDGHNSPIVIPESAAVEHLAALERPVSA